MDKLVDLPAERAVLAGIFQYGEDIYLDVVDLIQPSTFTDDTNRAIYKCFKYLFEQDVHELDQASVMSAASALKYEELFSNPQELSYIRSVFNGNIKQDNIIKWAAKIRKLEIARLLQEQLRSANCDIGEISGDEPIEQIIGIAEKAIFDFSTLIQGDDSEPRLMGDNIDEYLDNLEENPVDIVGISSGMPYYDQAIGGGFRRKTVSLAGARAKTGKSMLAVNIGLHVVNLGIPVLFLDTEMVWEDHISRMLPNRCKKNGHLITINQVETGKYTHNDVMRNAVRSAGDELKNLPFYHKNVSGKSFEELIAIMRRWIHKNVGQDENGNTKDCLIIYDYLKLMSPDGISKSLQEYQLMGFMTTTLHNFAVHHDVPILAFVQLNRDGIDNETSAAFAQSDRILWLVTNYSIFKIKSATDRAETGPQNGNRKLIPISARHGTGIEDGDYINIIMEGEYGTITEGETRNNLMYKKTGASIEDSIPFGDIDDELQRPSTSK